MVMMVLTTLRRRRTLLRTVTPEHATDPGLLSLLVVVVVLSVVLPRVFGFAAHERACQRTDQAVAHLMAAVASCYAAR